MPSVFLYFHAHQPNRLKEYSFFEIGNSHFYENDALNIHCLNEVSNNAYLPANQFFKTLIQDHPEFKFGLSFTGILIEQMEFNRQDVLQSFVDLTQCGNVEFVAETFYNSLAFHYSKTEFDRQIKLHLKKIEQHFGQRPKVFRNTGLIYNNQVAAHLESLVFTLGIRASEHRAIDDVRLSHAQNSIHHHWLLTVHRPYFDVHLGGAVLRRNLWPS